MMGRVKGRGRHKDHDPGELVHCPDGRSPLVHGALLVLGALVAVLAVVVLLPAIVVQELLRRRLRKTLLVGLLLSVIGAVMVLRGEEAAPVAPVVREQPLVLVDDLVRSEVAQVIVHRAGDAVAGLRVGAWKRGLEGGRPLAEGVTDAWGVAKFGVPSVGELTFIVQDRDGRRVAVPDGESLDLDQLGAFSGTVVGPLDEGVSAEVTVWLGAIRLATTRTDRSGAFRLEEVHAPGAVVVVTADGFVPSISALSGSAPLLRLRRGDVGSLRGSVVDEQGQPLANAIVRVLRGERGVLVAATDDQGTFDLPKLEVGAVTLEVHRRAQEIPALRTGARVLAGDPTGVDLRLEQPATLEVVVRTSDGLLSGAVVQVVDPAVTRYGGFPASRVQPERSTDAQGVARFASLPAGRYFVRATVPGRSAPLLAEVDLSPGGTAGVLLDERGTRALKVRVVDVRGEPVTGVFMDVSMPGINWHDMPSSRTDSNGVATFEGLPAGLAEVHLGKGDLWRMVRADGDEATFVWTEATSFDLEGRISGYEGEVLVASVLQDVVHVSHARVGEGGLLDTRITLPAGDARVFLIAHDRRLAPLELGAVGPGRELRGVRGQFVAGARVTGRLVDAETGLGIPGRVRFDGAIAGALEAQTQWLGGTDHDEWITVNEWSRATGPDGVFVIDGVPAGDTSIRLEALGAETRVEALDADARRDLGDLPLEPR